VSVALGDNRGMIELLEKREPSKESRELLEVQVRVNLFENLGSRRIYFGVRLCRHVCVAPPVGI
jgi:hypothetical protein